jgi:O-antigen ligase
MSNFYHDGTFSPASETVLDEPIATGTPDAAAATKETRTVTVRAPQASYGLFHYALLIYIYLFCTRVPELIPEIRLALAMTVIMLAGLMATGRGGDVFRIKLGKILTAFALWTAICIPFSVWTGGSFDVLKATVQAVLFVAFIFAFARTLPEVKHAMYSLGAAMGTVAVLSLTMFRDSMVDPNTGIASVANATVAPGADEQRLGLFHSATLQDPNFMSLYLLIGMPFLWLGARRGNTFTKLLFLALLPAVLVAIGHSASRMALILFAAGLLLFLLWSTTKERVFVLTSVVVAFAMIVPVLPQTTINRFTTLFHGKQDTFESEEAAASANVRMELLVRSIVMTATHPIFGVGPGQFAVAEDKQAKAEGKERGLWYYTHNAYTETSSEAGIPALVLYIMAIVTSYRGLGKIRKRGPTPDIREMAKAMQISLWMVILGGWFLTIGFGGVPFVIMGMAVAFKMAVAPQMESKRPALASADAAV